MTVDDTAARHAGRDEYTTHIGNDRFAWFATQPSKSRLNFLDLLRAGDPNYVINAAALAEASLALIRESGVTWKRAEGLQAIAREHLAGNLPTGDEDDIQLITRELVQLPIVGPWTAASALLWGVGAADAWPKGDVALLRAARLAYDRDGMTMRELDALAESWRPHRAIAARLLWTGLLGPGWE